MYGGAIRGIKSWMLSGLNLFSKVMLDVNSYIEGCEQ
jgi:hypothetical protein